MSQLYDEAIIDVERRKKSSEYNLGDPTLFPPEFLAWIKRYIEQSGVQLPASAIFGSLVPVVGSVTGMAPGLVLAYAAGTAPPGSLPCNGQSVARATYPRLFAVIGTTYGNVDAATFNLPDYRDRALFGIGATLTAVTDNDAQAHGSRGPLHRHTVTDPTHSHTARGSAAVGAAGGSPYSMYSYDTNYATNTTVASVNAAATGISVGPAGKPLDAPAYHGILYVITTG